MKLKSISISTATSDFLTSVINLSQLTPSLLPLLPVDTTAAKALREIYHETDGSRKGQSAFLHDMSGKLLGVLDQIEQHYSQLQPGCASKGERRGRFELKPKYENKKSQKLSKGTFKEQQKSIVEPFQNDQNVNLSNFDSMRSANPRPQPKPTLELRQITRPEYRRNLAHQVHRGLEDQESKQSIVRRDMPQRRIQVLQVEQVQVLPILQRGSRQRSDRSGVSSKSDRSVSPKTQARRKCHKMQLTNISSISKKVQTNSCLSLDLDIDLVNGFHEANDPSLLSRQQIASQYHSIRSVSSQSSQGEIHPDRKVRNEALHRRQQTDSREIRQEQPWECDQEEIEEELRQINERLTHRTNNLHLVQLQPQDHCFTRHQQKISPRMAEIKNKQPKTVRLSLTPTRNRLSPYSKKKTQRAKTKVAEVLQQEKESAREIHCAKWKKPKGGHITVDIQRYLSRE